jgi:hypothetical protein
MAEGAHLGFIGWLNIAHLGNILENIGGGDKLSSAGSLEAPASVAIGAKGLERLTVEPLVTDGFERVAYLVKGLQSLGNGILTMPEGCAFLWG